MTDNNQKSFVLMQARIMEMRAAVEHIKSNDPLSSQEEKFHMDILIDNLSFAEASIDKLLNLHKQ